MKTILKHITSYLLVLLVLVATTNMSVTKMTCFLSGNVVYSLQEMEDCSLTEGENSIQGRCCDFDKITLNYDYNTLVKTPQSSINDIVSIIEMCVNNGFNTFVATHLINFYTNSSPPLSGIDLLKIIQIFRL